MPEFQIRTRILHGPGSAERLGEIVDATGARKVLLITGPTLARRRVAERIAGCMPGKEITLFAEVEPEPSTATVEKGARIAREIGAELIVGLGGGSNLDAAKTIALLATNEGRAADYEGADKFANDPLPIVALPTTAGTASEMNPFSVLTDREKQRKFVITSRRIVPRVAILDPLLCATAPKSAVAAAGMDALTHAIESFTSKLATPFTRANSIYAARLISENLRQAVADPANADVMEKMLAASCMAGIAFSHTALGIVHAAALPIGAQFGVAHGVANAILLPYGMQFNSVAAPDLYAEIARAMGLETCDYAPAEAANAAIEMVQALSKDIGIPQCLSQLGVREDAFPAMARDAMTSRHLSVNPRPFTESDVAALYQAAF